MAAASIPVGVALTVLNGYSAREAVRLLRLLVCAQVPNPKPKPPPPHQLPLRLIGCSTEWDLFMCERLHCRMPVRDCLETRGALWPSGKRRGHPKRIECQGCPVGKANAERVPTYRVRPPWQPTEVLSASQRMAKRARALVVLDEHEAGSLSPLSEAATLTPEDTTDWRA